MMMMMNLQWITIVSTLIIGTVSAAHDASTTDSRRVVLWNENEYDTNEGCNDMDWQLIDDILVASAKMIENYGGTKHFAEDVSTSSEEDELMLNNVQAALLPPVRRYLRSNDVRTQKECKSLCAGYVRRFCPIPGCMGYNPNSDVAPFADSATTKTAPELDAIRQPRFDQKALRLRCKHDCKGYVIGMCMKPGCEDYNKQNIAVSPLDDSTTKAAREPNGIRQLHFDQNEERGLLTKSECKRLCAGYVCGMCPKPGCAGYNQNSEVVPLDNSAVTKNVPEPETNHQHLLDQKEARALRLRCKHDCRGYVIGMCPKPGCAAYNQNIAVPPLDDITTETAPELDQSSGGGNGTALDNGTTDTETEPQTTSAPDGTRSRKLKHAKVIKIITTSCTAEQTTYFHHKLNHLIRTNAVTSSCQALLKYSRQVICYRRNDDFHYVYTGTVL